MEWLFGRRMTPEEQLKKNQRALNKVTQLSLRPGQACQTLNFYILTGYEGAGQGKG